MEKASTPRNRLTRSSAKQVNTPSKKVEEDQLVQKSPVEEIKQSLRRTRRKSENKAKTNGDTSNIDFATIKGSESSSDNKLSSADDKLIEGCALEDSNENSSSTSIVQHTPSPKFARTLRPRRSITPGPELDLSSKKMKRSTSEGKLDSECTPTNKRGRRATSESKDFVFTPSKDKNNSVSESFNKHIPLATSSLRIIDKIDEANEAEQSSDDEKLEKQNKNLQEKTEDNASGTYTNVDLNASNVLNSPNESISQPSQSCEINKSNEVEGDKCINRSENMGEIVEGNPKICMDSEVSLNDKKSISKCDKQKENIDNNEVTPCDDDVTEIVENYEETVDISLKDKPGIDINEVTELKSNEVQETTPNGIVELTTENCVKEISQPTTSSPEKKILSPITESSENNDYTKNKISTEFPSDQEASLIIIESSYSLESSNKENKDENINDSELSGRDLEEHTIETEVDNKIKNTEIEINLVDDDESEESVKISNNETINDIRINNNEMNIQQESTKETVDPLPKSPIGSEHDHVEIKQLNTENSPCSKYEVSKIDLINSSDSEEGIHEEKLNSPIPVVEEGNDLIHIVEENELGNDNKVNINEINEFNNKNNKSDIAFDESKSYEINEIDNCQTDYDLQERMDFENASEIDKGPEGNIIENPNNGIVEHDISDVDAEIVSKGSYNAYMENPNCEVENQYNEQDRKEDNTNENLLVKPSSDQLMTNVGEENKLGEEVTDNQSSFKSSRHEIALVESDGLVEKSDKVTTEENFNDENFNEENFYENDDIEMNKSEGDSCDIYKDLSDGGSYDDRKNGSQFDESMSSELRSGESEDYATSEDNDESENAERNNEVANETKSISKDKNIPKPVNSKNIEKPPEKNPDSPMTYDKALAIINQNRKKKIDDEEFFDMFTQELNRVSEESGSDSDIAIVDEYLMEPEEPSKKNNQKSGNSQSQNNTKQPARPAPPLANRNVPQENYPNFSQLNVQNAHAFVHQHGHPDPTQHNHPALQRLNYSQNPMYQQYNHGIHMRGTIYNQFDPPPGTLQHSRIFGAQAQADINFSQTGMFNHALGSVSDSSYPSSPLKVRSISDMNNSQSSPVRLQNYAGLEQEPPTTVEENMPRNSFIYQENRNNVINTSTMTEGDNTVRGEKSANINQSCTPILDLLGLDKSRVKLLQKALGLNQIKKMIKQNTVEVQNLCKEKLKSEIKSRKRSRDFKDQRVLLDTDIHSLTSSTEQSSEETSDSSKFVFKDKLPKNYGGKNRKVNIEDGSVYVTLETKIKPRHRNRRAFTHYAIHKGLFSPGTSSETSKSKNNSQFSGRKNSKHQQQEKVVGKMKQEKKTTVLKSTCGTFRVDPLTSSQSSDSDCQVMDEECQLEDLKNKLKSDLELGKNKLSNIFTQHSFQKAQEDSRRRAETISFQKAKKGSRGLVGKVSSENSDGRNKESRKLPSQILETLAKEEKRRKRDRTDSGSDEVSERPKKIRKRNKKVHVKSVAADKNYIPCVTGGATQFTLSRLDKDGVFSVAEKAANFRTDQLYGASVSRITILDFKHK